MKLLARELEKRLVMTPTFQEKI